MMPRLPPGVFAIGIVLASGCRTVPAELPVAQSGAEPARADGVFVEAQPQTDDRQTGVTTGISQEIAGLYSCWFRDPYSYMFAGSGSPLEVGGGQHGMFMAGIHGLLYYGNLNTCAGALVGQPPDSYSDIVPLERLAGVPATLPAPHLPFANVNPEFIRHAREHWLPGADQVIDGVSTQLAYDRVFQRFFRLQTASLLMLLETTDIVGETKVYLRDTTAGSDGIDWLEQRYANRIPEFPEGQDGTTLTAPMAAGFWLRRWADGSFAEVWLGLQDVMMRFDAVWLAQQLASAPKAAAALGQISEGSMP